MTKPVHIDADGAIKEIEEAFKYIGKSKKIAEVKFGIVNNLAKKLMARQRNIDIRRRMNGYSTAKDYKKGYFLDMVKELEK